jgi:peptide/nickel transport system substrate-binding protein
MTKLSRRQALAGAGAAIAAPALAAGERARELRFIPQVDLVFIDPHFSMTNISRNFGGAVFDQLYGTTSQSVAHPQMAEGHVVEDGYKRWRIRLREGLMWHDGEKVLARDCVASIRRWGNRDVLGREIMALADEISAPDDRTIELRLKKPFPRLPESLGKPGAYMPAMMPERLAKTDPFKQIPEVIGSGPFRYVASERLQGVRNVFERFDKYVPRPSGTPDRGAGPKIVHFDRVVWTTMPDSGTALVALQKGEQDWWEFASQDLIPLIRKDRNLRGEVLETEGNYMFVRFDHLQPPFNRPEMRQVIMRAINQADFAAAVGGGDEFARPGVGFYPHGMPDATDAGMAASRKPFTDAEARAALKAAGYNGEKIVQITPGDYPNVKAASEVLTDLLKRIGINLDNVTMDWATMTIRVIKKGPAGSRWLPSAYAQRAEPVRRLAAGELAPAWRRGRGERLGQQPALRGTALEFDPGDRSGRTQAGRGGVADGAPQLRPARPLRRDAATLRLALRPDRRARRGTRSSGTSAEPEESAMPNWSEANRVIAAAEAAGATIGAAALAPDGSRFSHNGGQRFVAASTIKIAIMVELYRQVDAGRLRLDQTITLGPDNQSAGIGVLIHMHDGLSLTLDDVCFLMMSISDNSATNMLIDAVGMEAVNATMRALGLANSLLGRPCAAALPCPARPRTGWCRTSSPTSSPPSSQAAPPRPRARPPWSRSSSASRTRAASPATCTAPAIRAGARRRARSTTSPTTSASSRRKTDRSLRRCSRQRARRPRRRGDPRRHRLGAVLGGLVRPAGRCPLDPLPGMIPWTSFVGV